MIGDSMFASSEYGSNNALNMGYDANEDIEEILIFEPGATVDGDDGASF